MIKTLPNNNLATGVNYYLEGVNLLWRKELRLYILVPLAVNLLIFILLTATLFHYFNAFIDYLLNAAEWLKFLKWLLWIIGGAVFFLFYGYIFNAITNIVASPFYGLLAQKTEELVTGKKLDDEPLGKMIPRVIGREIHKMFYFLSRGIFMFFVLFLVGTTMIGAPLVPILAAAWGAWCMAIQYVDYACDNNQLAFAPMRKRLRANIYSSTGFGGMVMLASMIPLVNIFAMPAAVTGGTAFWIKELKWQGEITSV